MLRGPKLPSLIPCIDSLKSKNLSAFQRVSHFLFQIITCRYFISKQLYNWKENSFLVICSIRFGHKISELPIFPMKFKHIFVQIIEIWKFNRKPEFIWFLIPSKNVLIWSTSSLTKSLQVSFSLQDTKISWYSKSIIVKFVNNSFKSTICL